MTYHELPTNLDRDRSDYSGFMLGLLAGAAVGGGLALLFAPHEGAQTRHGLASGAQQAGRRVSEAYGSLAGTARRNASRLVGHKGGGVPASSPLAVSESGYGRSRPASEVIRDAMGEMTHTPPSSSGTTDGPGGSPRTADQSPLA